MKFPRILTTLVASLMLCATAQATIVTIAGSRAGPRAFTSSGAPVEGGLIRLGTFIGSPASQSIEDIELVFREFATGQTTDSGQIGRTFSNPAATFFDQRQVYAWVFDTPEVATASEHAIFTSFNPNPAEGDPWVFPTHIGNGIDSALLALIPLYTDADTSFTPGASFESSTDGLFLTPIPEPSGAFLITITTLGLALRRQR